MDEHRYVGDINELLGMLASAADRLLEHECRHERDAVLTALDILHARQADHIRDTTKKVDEVKKLRAALLLCNEAIQSVGSGWDADRGSVRIIPHESMIAMETALSDLVDQCRKDADND